MAGSISLSLSQQFDSLGEPLSGGSLYFFAAGTTTPQSAYQDVALTLPYPNPIELDSAGRIPPFYLADGQIKIRLADSDGVTQISADNLLVVGASSGSGSPPSVDATTVFSAGDLKPRYGTGSHSGWVRTNGRTIGSASSGASERANADCQDLFEFLWGADANLTVSTGRGASANADWVANKTIVLPDFRGRTIAGLDDMGSSAAGRLTSSYFGATATTLGAAGGGESTTLTAAQIPSITSTNASQTITVVAPGGLNFIAGSGVAVANTASGVNQIFHPLNATGNSTGASGSNSISVTSTGTSGNAHRTVPPVMLATIYIKL